MARRIDFMSVKILIPTALRNFAGGSDAVPVTGSTVRAAMETLVESHPALKKHLYSEQGTLRSFVNIYLNEEDIRYLEKENTPLKEGDILSIVPSIAGGSVVVEKPA